MSDVNAALERTRQLLKSGSRKEALTFIKQACKDYPTESAVWYLAATMVDDPALSADLLKKARRLDKGEAARKSLEQSLDSRSRTRLSDLEGVEVQASSPLLSRLARIAIMALVSILSAVLFLVLLYTHVIHYFSQPEAGYEPAWSPDGSHIAYTGLFADRQSVFVLNTQTGDQHNLFPVTLQPHIRPAWARDGKAIIWLTNPTRRIGMSIVGYDAAAGSVTSEPFEFWCCEAEDPTGYSAMYDAARLSPDGRWLVFSRDTDRTDSVIIRDLYLIEMPGDLLQNPRQLRSINLTNTPGLDESSPDWRPDSQLIVYSRITSESNQSELWTVDRTTGVRERLGNINGEAPRWSPDSQWIAYTSSSAGNYDIMLVRPDGSDQVNLTGQNRSNQFMPDWSPDSRQLVYTSWDTGASHLWVMAVDGSNPRNLTVEAQRSASNRFAQLLVPVGIVLLCGLLLFLPRNWLRPVRKK